MAGICDLEHIPTGLQFHLTLNLYAYFCYRLQELTLKTLRVLVAALWDKKLAFRTRERRKILDFYGRTATQGEKEIFGRAVLRFNSASEKEDQTASCSCCEKSVKLIYSVNGESVRRKKAKDQTFGESVRRKAIFAVLRFNSASEKKSVLLKDQTDL
ncbi:hypothetical protein TNCV_1462001 [Trichonephila clavipes]|nr:hypothetical protein TNCV_1462001 [Trichonephila clavipes]